MPVTPPSEERLIAIFNAVEPYIEDRYGVPVIAFAGTLGRGADDLVGRGFEAVVPIMPGPGTLADALADGPNNLERAAATAMRLIKLGAAG